MAKFSLHGNYREEPMVLVLDQLDSRQPQPVLCEVDSKLAIFARCNSTAYSVSCAESWTVHSAVYYRVRNIKQSRVCFSLLQKFSRVSLSKRDQAFESHAPWEIVEYLPVIPMIADTVRFIPRDDSLVFERVEDRAGSTLHLILVRLHE